MHNVPVKLAMERGVGAGLARVLATALALRQPVSNGRSDPFPRRNHPIRYFPRMHFWLLLAVALLSMLDFYLTTIMGWAWSGEVGRSVGRLSA